MQQPVFYANYFFQPVETSTLFLFIKRRGVKNNKKYNKNERSEVLHKYNDVICPAHKRTIKQITPLSVAMQAHRHGGGSPQRSTATSTLTAETVNKTGILLSCLHENVQPTIHAYDESRTTRGRRVILERSPRHGTAHSARRSQSGTARRAVPTCVLAVTQHKCYTRQPQCV